MRSMCPDEETLVDYLEGRLQGRAGARIERHLARCDRCPSEIALLLRMAAPDALSGCEPPPPAVTEQALASVRALRGAGPVRRAVRAAGDRVSRWTRALQDFVPLGRSGLAVVRGSKTVISEDVVLLKKTFADLEVTMEIEKTTPGRATIRVLPPRQAESGGSVRASLFSGEREVSSGLLGPHGTLFEGIPFGHYLMVFYRDGKPVGEYPFEIKDRGDG